MIIGIDVRVLGQRVKSGIEEYAENLIPEMIKAGPEDTFKLFFSSRTQTLPDYDWLKLPNVEVHRFKYSNQILFGASRFLNRPKLDKWVGGADVFFFPHFFISALSPSCKRVTAFHDLSYVHFPEFLTARKKIWHNFQMNPQWQAKFSDKIIAVSESTKKDLAELYKIDPARIEVVHSGVSPSMKRAADEEIKAFIKEKGLPARFVLYLGKLEPRKNIPGIIRAFNKLKRGTGVDDLGLVIAGAKGWSFAEIFRQAEQSPYKNQIVFAGQVKDEERRLYYSAAEIFVYPSFFEGFGFPPLEAMLCMTPVITSRNSSLPEVAGDSAVLVDPYDAGELAFWLDRILKDGDFRGLLKEKGLKQAAQFTWEKAAESTLKALKMA